MDDSASATVLVSVGTVELLIAAFGLVFVAALASWSVRTPSHLLLYCCSAAIGALQWLVASSWDDDAVACCLH